MIEYALIGLAGLLLIFLGYALLDRSYAKFWKEDSSYWYKATIRLKGELKAERLIHAINQHALKACENALLSPEKERDAFNRGMKESHDNYTWAVKTSDIRYQRKIAELQEQLDEATHNLLARNAAMRRPNNKRDKSGRFVSKQECPVNGPGSSPDALQDDSQTGSRPVEMERVSAPPDGKESVMGNPITVPITYPTHATHCKGDAHLPETLGEVNWPVTTSDGSVLTKRQRTLADPREDGDWIVGFCWKIWINCWSSTICPHRPNNDGMIELYGSDCPVYNDRLDGTP